MNSSPSSNDRPPAFFRGLLSAAALMALLGLVALLGALLASALSGCASAPPGAWDEATNAAVRAAVAIREARERDETPLPAGPAADPNPDAGEAEGRDPATTPEAPAADPAPASPSEAPAPALDFRYGGFRGGGAKEDPRCRISSFRMTGSGMSFRWESSPRIPADWKRNDGEKGPMIVAAIFFWDGEKWIGGKFDWIDESRTTRDFKNIYGDYNGWSADAFFGGSRHAFCVGSADGKWRSNLITE